MHSVSSQCSDNERTTSTHDWFAHDPNGFYARDRQPETKIQMARRALRNVRRVLSFCALLLTFGVVHPLFALEITTTGIIGYGTTLRSDGFFLGARGPSSFPLNNSGIVVISKTYSEYPNPGDGFLLTNGDSTYNIIVADVLGSLILDGFAINDVNALTYQRGPIFQGHPQYYQFFSLAPPYGGVTAVSEPYASYSFNVYTNSAGQGVARLEGSFAPDGQSRVVRLNGDGTSTALAIDPTYLSSFARPTKILENGDIYVALLNYGNQRYEIWRFVAGETENHTVVYSLPSSEAGLHSWDVNQNGALVVSEGNAQGQVLVKRISPDGTGVVVEGTQIGGPFIHAGYSAVFINSSGRIAAVRSYTDLGVSKGELLYADPGGVAVPVLGIGDILNGGVIVSLMPMSEMNESGQLTLAIQLNVSPLSPPTRQLVVRVDPLATPTIASFSPTSGAIGTAVTINGTNFAGATVVTFNAVEANFNVESATQITAMVPPGVTTGPIAIGTPSGTVTSSALFTVTTAPQPSIASFSPTSGGIGSSVTIKGANFTGATAVKFNGVSAVFKLKRASQIAATVPNAATTGPITVTTPGGTATGATSFTVIPAPTISDLSPSSGTRGLIVTITGTNFTGASAVKFKGSKAIFTIISPTTITATVPNGAKTGPVTVMSPGGTATSVSGFTVLK